jgi:hypothetical protein
MAPGSGRFLRDNAFLVAAVALPLLVVAFFLLATIVPRWIVPPPAYDLVLSAANAYTGTRPRIAVDFKVRDGRLEATARPLQPNEYAPERRLFLFEHGTMNVREIHFDLPDMAQDAPRQTIVVDAFGGRRILAETKAPDGYQLESRTNRGPGLIGDIFGMNRYGQRVSLVNRGRVVSIGLPPPYEDTYQPGVSALGWLVNDGQP